jgi:hypothetical protein
MDNMAAALAAETSTGKSTKAPVRKSRQTVVKKADGKEEKISDSTVKATVVMSRDLDFILGAVAGHQDMNRSELAVKLIRKGLKTDHPALYTALLKFTKLSDQSDKANGEESSGDNDRQVA